MSQAIDIKNKFSLFLEDNDCGEQVAQDLAKPVKAKKTKTKKEKQSPKSTEDEKEEAVKNVVKEAPLNGYLPETPDQDPTQEDTTGDWSAVKVKAKKRSPHHSPNSVKSGDKPRRGGVSVN